jgi:hypothetical protein
MTRLPVKSSQAPILSTQLPRLELQLTPTVDIAAALLTATIQPALQVLALANIEHLELIAALHNGLDSNTRYANAPSNRQLAQLKQV